MVVESFSCQFSFKFQVQFRRVSPIAEFAISDATPASDADFLYKIELTLREAKESKLCLAKVRLGRLDGFKNVADLEREAGELCAIFASIAIKVAHRLGRESKKTQRPKAGGQPT